MQWFSPEESQSVIDALSDTGWISRQDVTLYLSDGVKLEIPSLGWRPMTRRMLSPPIYNLNEKTLVVIQPRIYLNQGLMQSKI